ncbi:MAG TPA: hybrid sensor histidine kinase/response regulator, partial [Polyangia bacterium]
ELRTPLTPVLMAASALRHQRELPAHLRDVFAMIVRNVQIEARLVDDLLDVTRITQGKMSADRVAADLHELVRTACESFGVELLNKRQSIWIELKAEQTSVSVDLVRMQQLFGNLLSNAIKFGPTEGEIRIRSWNDASNIMIEVEDDGIGIESGNVPRIFEPFNQLEIDPSRTISGLGLGLTICRGIAELHGGRVDATSRGRGLGARFVVQLPVLEQPTAVADADGLAAAPTPAPMPPPVESSDSCRILLVEDHEDTADLLADLLADEGYEVSKVTNIREALAVDIETIDVIVSDLGLPDGSGLDLIRRLQEASSRHHPAIALSGFGTGSDVQASKEAGFDVHLTKPVDFDRLVGMIRAFDPRRRPEQFGDAQTPQLSSATPRRRN